MNVRSAVRKEIVEFLENCSRPTKNLRVNYERAYTEKEGDLLIEFPAVYHVFLNGHGDAEFFRNAYVLENEINEKYAGSEGIVLDWTFKN